MTNRRCPTPAATQPQNKRVRFSQPAPFDSLPPSDLLNRVRFANELVKSNGSLSSIDPNLLSESVANVLSPILSLSAKKSNEMSIHNDDEDDGHPVISEMEESEVPRNVQSVGSAKGDANDYSNNGDDGDHGNDGDDGNGDDGDNNDGDDNNDPVISEMDKSDVPRNVQSVGSAKAMDDPSSEKGDANNSDDGDDGDDSDDSDDNNPVICEMDESEVPRNLQSVGSAKAIVLDNPSSQKGDANHLGGGTVPETVCGLASTHASGLTHSSSAAIDGLMCRTDRHRMETSGCSKHFGVGTAPSGTPRSSSNHQSCLPTCLAIQPSLIEHKTLDGEGEFLFLFLFHFNSRAFN